MDETFRWNTFGNRGFFRFAVEDLEIHGQKIKKGEIVQIMFSIAYYDPAVFPASQIPSTHCAKISTKPTPSVSARITV